MLKHESSFSRWFQGQYRISHWRCSTKKLFLKILQYSHENKSAFLLKRDSNTGVFQWILQNLLEHLFWRKSGNGGFHQYLEWSSTTRYFLYATLFFSSVLVLLNNHKQHPLREKCPNMALFLIRIFSYLDCFHAVPWWDTLYIYYVFVHV